MKWFFGILFFLFAIGIGIGAFVWFDERGTGEYAGEVVKIEKRGVIFKTYEGELNTGSLHNSGGATSSQVPFSVYNNPVAVEKLREAVGHRVRITYDEKFVTLPIWGDTKYLVQEVEIIE